MRPNINELSCRGHDTVFRKREPNPKLCWILVSDDGRTLARSDSEMGLLTWKRLNRMAGRVVQEPTP